MNEFVKEMRIKQLRLMHELMAQANDEGIYWTWSGVAVPDCPTDEDFESIAEDEENYNECFNAFVKLIADKGNRY